MVHGKAAIAAAISLRSYLLCTTLTKSQRTVTLRFSDLKLEHTWNITDLPWGAFSDAAKRKMYHEMVTSLDPELVDAMQPYIANVSPDVEPHARKQHQAAASAFLYLFLSLGNKDSPACDYAMRSTIPIGQGLGSSASVCVCIATALLIQCRALSGPHPDQQSAEAEEQLDRINRWAFVGELAIHGNPSGVDNTVATNGHAVLFQRTGEGQPPSVSVLRDFPELPLLLIDTCVPKSTATEVAKVGALKKRHPAVVEGIMDSIGAITHSVYDVVSKHDFASGAEENIIHLGELMAVNQGLLIGLGVSHPRLERLRHLVNESGVGWMKLTGGGGGGCGIVLLKPEVTAATQETNGAVHDNSSSGGPTQSALRELESRLSEEGFDKYEATLGGDGAGICYPAVINGTEIDQDTFLNAQGQNGIIALVGGDHDSSAWKHWRP